MLADLTICRDFDKRKEDEFARQATKKERRGSNGFCARRDDRLRHRLFANAARSSYKFALDFAARRQLAGPGWVRCIGKTSRDEDQTFSLW